MWQHWGWVTDKVVAVDGENAGEKQLAHPLALRFPGGPAVYAVVAVQAFDDYLSRLINRKR